LKPQFDIFTSMFTGFCPFFSVLYDKVSALKGWCN